MCISALFSRRPDDIDRLYFSDLAGAALACLSSSRSSPRSARSSSSPVSRSCCSPSVSSSRVPRTRQPFSRGDRRCRAARRDRLPPTGARSVPRRARACGRAPTIPASEWSALFRVDAAAVPRQHRALPRRDLGSPSAVGRRPGLPRPVSTPTTDRPVRCARRPAGARPHHRCRRRQRDRRIDPLRRRADRCRRTEPCDCGSAGQYAEYSAISPNEPRSTTSSATVGATWPIRRGYDLVWFVAPDSYAASNAASSGAFVLSESYLYTKEMLQDSVEHLDRRRHGRDAVRREGLRPPAEPHRPPRGHRARSVRQRDIEPFHDHIAVVTSTAEGSSTAGSTTMMKSSPFTDDELDRIEAQLAVVPNARSRTCPAAPVTTAHPSTRSSRRLSPTAGRRRVHRRLPLRRQGDLGQPAVLLALHAVLTGDQDIGDPSRTSTSRSGSASGCCSCCSGSSISSPRCSCSCRSCSSAPPGGPARQGDDRTDLRPARPGVHRLRDHADPALLAVPRISDLLADRDADGDPARRPASARSSAAAGMSAPQRMLAPWPWRSSVSAPSTCGSPDARGSAARLAAAGQGVLVIALCAPLGFCLGMFMPLAISLVARPRHSNEYVAWGWAINGFFSVIGRPSPRWCR